MRTPDFKDSFVAACKRDGVVCIPTKPFDYLLCYEGMSAFVDVMDCNFDKDLEFRDGQLRSLCEVSVGGLAGWVVRADDDVYFIQAKVVKMLDRAIGPDDGIDLGKRSKFSVRKIFTFSSFELPKKKGRHH